MLGLRGQIQMFGRWKGGGGGGGGDVIMIRYWNHDCQSVGEADGTVQTEPPRENYS